MNSIRVRLFTSVLPALLASVLSAGPVASPEDAEFDQRIGAQLPLATEFRDAEGAPHPLSACLQGRPAVLYFGYARCPQLCAVVADTTVSALRQIRAEVGRDFDVIAISIDPHETTSEAEQRRHDALQRYGASRSTAGWHFLIGDERAIAAVADACGFRFRFDPVSRQFAHPSGFIVVRPEGRIARYFVGLEYPPNDVSQAIARAARGEIGPRALDVLLRCFRGDDVAGRFGPLAWRTLQIAVALTVILVAIGIGRMLRDERRARAAREA